MRSRTVIIMALLSAACGGGGSSSTPTAPTPTPPAAPTRIVALSGDLAFGSVAVGQSAERTLTIRNTGNATLTVTGMTGPSGYSASWTSGAISAGGSQAVTIRFSPLAPQSYAGTLTVNGDQTSGTNTIAISGTGTGPRTQFGPGQYRVHADIQAARYYSDPADGCYWERQRGFSGNLSDVIANDFIGFNALQSIVDILPSDVAFETDSDCGTWYQSPRHPAQSTIRPGTWLVGTQIQPGLYTSNVVAGCYWERLNNFEGVLSSINDNDFVSTSGPRVVEIVSSDAGFSSDDDCGTWTRTSGDGVERPMSQTKQGTIESRREANRATWSHRTR